MVAGHPSEEPLSAADAADRMLAAHGKSFHWARRFLGPAAARQATLLYAFCRFLDDIADGDLPGGLPRLRAIDAALAARSAVDLLDDTPEVATFLALSEEAAIPSAAARDLIAGLIFDQGTVAVVDEAALIVYAYQVAGTVGLMMAPILGRRDARADAFAVDLGIAMQLTNIARDVAEDARLGRRYLPASWCGALTPAKIAAGVSDPAAACRAPVAGAVAETLARAETYYASGLAGLAYLPWRNDLAMGVAATVYRAIGRRLTRRRHAWWRGRQVVGVGGKVLFSAASLPRLVCRWRPPPAHDGALHAPLRGIASVDALS